MATQGMVSVRKNGRVVMKIVVGCNGYKAHAVAKTIRMMRRVPTKKEANNISYNVGFGGDLDKVIVTKSNAYRFTGQMGLYQSTFHKPEFNPRWKRGTVDYLEIVDLPS